MQGDNGFKLSLCDKTTSTNRTRSVRVGTVKKSIAAQIESRDGCGGSKSDDPGTIQEVTMPQVRVSAGPIDYRDTGGDKPVVVFLHGVLMDGHLFDFVVDALRTEYRCILPTLPLGA